MADSGITKRALADALKALMDEMPFAKISVADICEKCDMNRKSFYYHFKDKYDLVNWIIDTEILRTVVSRAEARQSGDRLYELFVYMYENQSFIRKVAQIEGQNSPVDHFRVLLFPLLTDRFTEIFGDDTDSEFRVNFFYDAFGGTVIRWISSSDPEPPDVFMRKLRSCVKAGAQVVYKVFDEFEKNKAE